jgi:proteasome lid subunit RPN8/RPN11
MKTRLTLSRDQVDEIIEHVNRHIPLEACGLLAGKNDRVEKVLFVQNRAQSPVRFVMDPSQQLKAFNWIDDNRLDLLGIFHSHPAGPETASPTDITEAAYEVVHIICSRITDRWNLRGFWIADSHATEVILQIVE